jgi:hypothetical protein
MRTCAAGAVVREAAVPSSHADVTAPTHAIAATAATRHGERRTVIGS